MAIDVEELGLRENGESQPRILDILQMPYESAFNRDWEDRFECLVRTP